MFVLTCLAIIAGTLFLWLLKYWWTNRKFYSYARSIPQIEGSWPLFGHLHLIIGATAKEIYLGNKLATRAGPSPRKLWLGPVLVVVVDDPDHLQKMLTSKYCVDKPD